MSKADVLIVAPYAAELEGLAPLLGKNLTETVRGLRVTAKAVGIGLTAAAGRTASRLDAVHPRAVVLLGTCAAYPGVGLQPGQVVVAQKCVLADATVLEGRASFPEPVTGVIEPNAVLANALGMRGSGMVCVATPLAVTTDAIIAQRFAGQLGCHVEHHEAFGVAMSCAPQHAPFAAVFGVSHEMGPNGREVWRVRHRAAAHAAANLVAAWLQSGAAGLPHQEG